jgi:hypothetical protein
MPEAYMNPKETIITAQDFDAFSKALQKAQGYLKDQGSAYVISSFQVMKIEDLKNEVSRDGPISAGKTSPEANEICCDLWDCTSGSCYCKVWKNC